MFNFWKKKEKKPTGGQGNHFAACFPEEGLTQKIVTTSINKPDNSEEFHVNVPDFKNAKLNVYSKLIDKSLIVNVLLINKNLYTAYPINKKFSKIKKCQNPRVTEWQNEMEAWVEVDVEPTVLKFFPTDYYKNKDKYENSKGLDIVFSGIAYHISKQREEDIVTKKGTFKTGKTCVLLKADYTVDSSFPDDYFFGGEILDIKTGKDYKLFLVKIINLEKDKELSIWVRCVSSNIKDNLKKGDYVSGMFWLQGKII